MKNNTFFKLWGMPVLLAIISLFALIVALADDGIWDAVAWVLLLIPLYLIVKHYYFGKK